MPTNAAAYQRQYMAGYRLRSATVRDGQKARGRALERLAKCYPEDFERLVDEERATFNLSPKQGV